MPILNSKNIILGCFVIISSMCNIYKTETDNIIKQETIAKTRLIEKIQDCNINIDEVFLSRTIDKNVEEYKYSDNLSSPFISKSSESSESNRSSSVVNESVRSLSFISNSNRSSVIKKLSSSISEEELSEIISIINEDENLNINTKRIIKVNVALLMLIQKKNF